MQYGNTEQHLTPEAREALIRSYLGKTVDVVIDRPIGFVHHTKGITLHYTVNYGFLPGVSGGDGPIDSAFRAIEQCIGHHYELDDYQVQSVTEGKEALGSALVRLRVGGKLYSGNGTSTDIVAASIRAYINALNKIVFEEA